MKQSNPKPNFLICAFQENRWLTVYFCLWLALVSILLPLNEQGHWILYFSDHRTPFWDFFFKYGTRFAEEWAFVGALIILLLIRFRAAITFPILLVLTLLISSTSKKFFLHPRPLKYFTDLGFEGQLTFIEGVKVNMGLSSFPSGHTMAGFAIFTFLALNARNKKWAAIGFFSLAIMVGISRIYLVQHFLKDVFLGSVLGFAIAILSYYIQQRWKGKQWLDRNLLNANSGANTNPK